MNALPGKAIMDSISSAFSRTSVDNLNFSKLNGLIRNCRVLEMKLAVTLSSECPVPLQSRFRSNGSANGGIPGHANLEHTSMQIFGLEVENTCMHQAYTHCKASDNYSEKRSTPSEECRGRIPETANVKRSNFPQRANDMREEQRSTRQAIVPRCQILNAGLPLPASQLHLISLW
jgi:hypothetical protein